MDTNDLVSVADERLASEFRKACEASVMMPDVAAFLARHPEATIREQADVLRVDLRLRWMQGEPRPVKAYLRQFPEIACRAELVRMLVEADLGSRREFVSRPITVIEPLPDAIARAQTQKILDPHGDLETVAEGTTGGPPSASVPPFQTTVANDPKLTLGRAASHEDPGYEVATSVERRARGEEHSQPFESHRFTVLSRLGAGGMGVVYEAYDQERGEYVALKTMRQIDHHSLARFKQEFRTLCDITHPNLVSLYQLFAVENTWFFTMELVRGCDFLAHVRGRLADERLPETRLSHEPMRAGPEHSAGPRPVDPGTADFLDQRRLRDALVQLAEGVQTLHLAGKLHRDIKPSNVLVDGRGRVVLLDFGLTADLGATGEHRPTERQVVGTLAHMSPEQAVGGPVTPASDWYSVGVMLYQALAGRLPFEGAFEEVVAQKLKGDIAPPDGGCDGLPADLVTLCMDLLRPDPADRPVGLAVLARLKGQPAVEVEHTPPGRHVPLIGRMWHRQVLDTAFANLLAGQASAVFIRGRTGMGKTALVRSFLDDIREAEETVVLHGRCYEREWVPYKAFDSLVDGLARYLKPLEDSELARILPHDASLLCRVFPVLRGMEGRLGPLGLEPVPQDPQEVRTRVFAVFRALLSRLGQRANLVLVIDDLQWGDADSALLLAELLYGPDPPRMLFLGCYRMEDEDRSGLLPILGQAQQRPGLPIVHRELAVEPLTLAESRELARSLIGLEETAALAMAHLVARESEGNPLFIDELARYVRAGGLTGDWDDPTGLDLEDVLWARIRAQPPDAQRLLEVVSVAGRPIQETLSFRAAGLEQGGRIALGSLRSGRLIRNLGSDQVDRIETYQDRIRATVRQHLEPEALREIHRRLAGLLEASDEADPEALADHFQGAGDTDRACSSLSRAADQAAAALAFDQAARLYLRALDLHRGPAAEERRICRRLGQVLSSSGRGAEAANYFLRAARDADPGEGLELRRLASTQLLLCGRVSEGLSLLQSVLEPLGLRMPSSPRRAWFSLMRHRALVRLRGTRFRTRDESQVPAETLSRIDLCWSAVAGLNMIDPIVAADFQARGLLVALRAGEPYRVARALAMEAAHHATAGLRGADRAAEFLESAESLARSVDSHHLRGILKMVRGIVALMQGRWPAANEEFERAGRIFRAHGADVTWERGTVNTLNLLTLLHMGRFGELRERCSALTREAQDRGDLFAATMLTTLFMGMIHLADNVPGRIEQEIADSIAPWEGTGFLIQHSSAFRSLVHLDLYRGHARQARDRVTRVWPEYSRSLLFRIQIIRIQLQEIQGRCTLAVAETTEDRAQLLGAVEECARELSREGTTWAQAHAEYLRAGIAACRGDVATAVHHLTVAAERYDEVGMALNAAVMRYRAGEVQPGDEARTLISRSERAIRDRSINSPRQWAQMMAPGFGPIASCQAETSAESPSHRPE